MQVERRLERNWSVGETLFVASTGPRPRGRGMTATKPSIYVQLDGFNGAAPARARNA